MIRTVVPAHHRETGARWTRIHLAPVF